MKHATVFASTQSLVRKLELHRNDSVPRKLVNVQQLCIRKVSQRQQFNAVSLKNVQANAAL